MGNFTTEMLNFLPAKARTKAIRLDEDFDAAAAAVKAAQRDLEDGWRRRDAVEMKLHAAGKSNRPGSFRHPLETLRKLLAAGDETINPALARIELEIGERLQPRYDRAAEAFQSHSVVQQLAYWIADAQRAGVKLRDAAPVNLRSKDPRREVEDARRELEDLAEKLDRVELAPQPLSAVRAAIVAEIDEIAAKGRPAISFASREVGPLRLDRQLGLIKAERGAQIAETLVWLLRDQAVAKALMLVGDTEPENAMTNEQRDAALDRLASEILTAGRREEAAIEACAVDGIAIARRPDADPRAVLGVEETSPAWRSRFDIGVVEIGR